MYPLRLKCTLVLFSALLYIAFFLLNEWIFNSDNFELIRGVNWIYLPAGARLLCTLLFGGAGAIGVVLASWLAASVYYFPDHPGLALLGGIASGLAPYVTYQLAQRITGLRSSLINLSGMRLLALIVAYAIASPCLHHVLWLLTEEGATSGSSLSVMMIGDLVGALVVVYTIRMILTVLPAVTLARQGPR